MRSQSALSDSASSATICRSPGHLYTQTLIDEARSNGARLPLTALVDQFYADVQSMGGNRWDTSGLLARLERDSRS